MARRPRVRLSKANPLRIGSNRKVRRVLVVATFLLVVVAWVINNPASYETVVNPSNSEAAAETSSEIAASEAVDANAPKAVEILEKLEVKGRAPKTGYSREEFYKTWPTVDGCSLRQRIIKREFGNTATLDGCDVISGSFVEPYTGQSLSFAEKAEISKGIQIDHVVALSDAWQKGAQYLPQETRYAMATDPLNLLAVDASANQQKSDGDAATWLPKNKAFRCNYVARQVSVKYKYGLWVAEAEKNAIAGVLATCPNEPAVGV